MKRPLLALLLAGCQSSEGQPTCDEQIAVLERNALYDCFPLRAIADKVDGNMTVRILNGDGSKFATIECRTTKLEDSL